MSVDPVWTLPLRYDQPSEVIRDANDQPVGRPGGYFAPVPSFNARGHALAAAVNDATALRVRVAELLAIVQRLDYYREALLAKEYAAGSTALTELLDDARAAIAKHGGRP